MITERTKMIAKTCYAAEREWQLQNGNNQSNDSWDDLSQGEQDEKLMQVDFLLNNPTLGAAAVHDRWIARRKEEGGWVFGPTFDEEAKTDPKMMQFNRLSPVDQTIGLLYRGIVSVVGRI